MTIKNLNKQKEILQDQLYNLHYMQLDPDTYKQERLNIEIKLVRIEGLIQYETNLLPFKYTIWIAFALMLIGLSYIIIKTTWK